MLSKSGRNRSSLQISNSFSFSKTLNNQPSLQNGPYRATKLWQKSIDLFVSGIPLGTHRSGAFPWKTYDTCFKASEAITWFHKRLQNEFDPLITRPQSYLLLQKFFKAGVFIGVGCEEDKGPGNRDEGDFKDNFWQLYKLGDEANICSNEIHQKENTPELKSKASASAASSKNYTIIINPLSVEEINQIWWDCFLERLVSVAGAEILDVCPSLMANSGGQWISYNVQNVGNYGVVKLKPEHVTPPTWLISAMKCLVGWPNSKVDNPLFCPEMDPHETASYPNFENDVFRLVTNYFESFKLLSPELHELFIACFIRAEMYDFNRRISNNRVFTPKGIKRASKRQESYPFPRSESTDNLVVDILTPARNSSWTAKPRRIFNESFANTTATSTNILPSPMSVRSYKLDNYVGGSGFYYETAFTQCNTPITRVVSQTELRSTLPRRVLNLSTPALATANGGEFGYENPTLTLSPGDLINHPRFERVLAGLQSQQNESCSYREFYEDSFVRKCQSSVDVREDPGWRSPHCSTRPLRNGPGGCGGSGLDFYYGAGACVPGLITYEGKSLAIECFRLLTLLLPPSKRRHLQLLLRFMIKVSRNEKLMLDVGANNRTIMINTFYRSIFSTTPQQQNFDDLLALRIVTFMMDNDQTIFNVSQETENEGVYGLAMECIKRIQIKKVPVPPQKKSKKANKENNLNYCSKISMSEYEDQRLLGATSKSLRNLLEAIVANENMEEKAKRKTLKKFQKEYPHIYAEKFGSINSAGGSGGCSKKPPKPPTLDNRGSGLKLNPTDLNNYADSSGNHSGSKRKPFRILKTLGL